MLSLPHTLFGLVQDTTLTAFSGDEDAPVFNEGALSLTAPFRGRVNALAQAYETAQPSDTWADEYYERYSIVMEKDALRDVIHGQTFKGIGETTQRLIAIVAAPDSGVFALGTIGGVIERVQTYPTHTFAIIKGVSSLHDYGEDVKENLAKVGAGNLFFQRVTPVIDTVAANSIWILWDATRTPPSNYRRLLRLAGESNRNPPYSRLDLLERRFIVQVTKDEGAGAWFTRSPGAFQLANLPTFIYVPLDAGGITTPFWEVNNVQGMSFKEIASDLVVTLPDESTKRMRVYSVQFTNYYTQNEFTLIVPLAAGATPIVPPAPEPVLDTGVYMMVLDGDAGTKVFNRTALTGQSIETALALTGTSQIAMRLTELDGGQFVRGNIAPSPELRLLRGQQFAFIQDSRNPAIERIEGFYIRFWTPIATAAPADPYWTTEGVGTSPITWFDGSRITPQALVMTRALSFSMFDIRATRVAPTT